MTSTSPAFNASIDCVAPFYKFKYLYVWFISISNENITLEWNWKPTIATSNKTQKCGQLHTGTHRLTLTIRNEGKINGKDTIKKNGI